MGALRLPSLSSIFTSSSSTTRCLRSPSIFRRHHRLRLPPRPLTAANLSAQSTAEKEVSPVTSEGANQKSRVQDRAITPRSQDFNAWYLDIIANAELADYGPVRGTMVIRPYGYAIWEAIQDYLNVKFKETGHSNMYFPQFIPYSFIEKEASHVEGFSPELAVVTIGGGKELEEKLVVRPTSETIVNHMFTQWIHSYRDLPLMVNQWANVTRWEMRTKPFVRTLEFLWQEGHTAHATLEEAEKEFTDETGQRQHVWQTSWAISTRFIGGIIMTHGDDAGLMLPPKIAPIQVVIVPIWKKDDERTGVLNAALSVNEILKTAGIKVKIDDTDQRTPGWKFNFWEMKGVPLRIEIGPRDVLSESVVISRRDVPGKQGKVFGISMEASILVAYVKDNNIVDVNSYNELKDAISQGKWARGPWSASDKDELRVKEETGATIRCFPFEQPEGRSKACLMTGNPAEEVAIFAKSY
ncbi:hypothetical protein LOK49_LG07G00357 [Camellia lanceoleosa]|uniref:Uncharacterized protein n=1 Tax=Camellia lanceoleosa TaxID=1840588 RepID=A0ACC0H8W9_9ERIC|nr:hypothetical protein LOK49_LG07G00357 [Camellia lanceoleosa]